MNPTDDGQAAPPLTAAHVRALCRQVERIEARLAEAARPVFDERTAEAGVTFAAASAVRLIEALKDRLENLALACEAAGR